MRFKLTLYKSAIYASFFPFVSLAPINSDVQPLFLFFLLMIYCLDFKEIRLNKWVLIFSLLFLFYLIPFSNFTEFLFKEFFIFYSPIFLIPVYKLIFEKIDVNNIARNCLIIYFIFSIIFYFFPKEFITIQNIFIRHTNTEGIGYRGISTFSPEPGLFAGTLIGILLLYIKTSSNRNIKIITTALISIFLSKSGTSISYLVAIYLYNYRRNIIYVISLIFLTFIIIQYLDFENLGRGFEILKIFFENPYLFLKDNSILTRLVHFSIGFKSLMIEPLGHGLYNFTINYRDFIGVFSFANDFYIQSGKPIGGSNSPLGKFLFVFGFPYLLFISFIFYRSSSLNIFKIYSLILISFSYSYAFPLVWILLAYDKNK